MTLIRAYTFMGDRVADPYAALMPKYGFKRLIEMVDQACRHGIESVADAPPELRGFIAAMETVPDWLDMAMVEEGARIERAAMAIMSPIAIRAAFIAALRDLAMAAKAGDTARFLGAPYYAPRRRLDETRAARTPVLRWRRPAPVKDAAE